MTRIVLFAVAYFVCVITSVNARDDGRYAHDPLHNWFEHLQSGKGLCCSFADGFSIENVDWDTGGPDGTYRVHICAGPWKAPDQSCRAEWINVPPDAVVSGPNLKGPAIVWPYQGEQGETLIRCFLPGAGV